MAAAEGSFEEPIGRGSHRAEFRFYEELNDFLPAHQRKRSLSYAFDGKPGVKDPIEAFGIPHTEVELIVVDGQSVGFDYRLQPDDRVAVYPMFESFDVTSLVRLRDQALRRTAFVVDVNLGKLARRLRLLGFDVLYDTGFHDDQVAAISAEQHRIVLTRDRRLLFIKCITHGYWVRSVQVDEQLREVLARFDLAGQIQPFARCIVCNGELVSVAKQDVDGELEPKTRLYFEHFRRCPNCRKVYWEGSHVDDMRQRYLGGIAGNP